MPTTREFLGDSLIKELEGAGFSPESINTFARNEYRQRKAAQEDKLRRLEYKADDMGLEGKLKEALINGEVSEEEVRNAQKFKDIGSIKHGWGLGGAKTVAGNVDAAERVSDFVNPFYEGQRDEKGDYVYQNAIEKGLRPKIKSVERLRDDYEKATGEIAWGSRIIEGITQIVGDPVNFISGLGLLSKGSKLAQFGKKSLYFAGTGAASGGVMALGEGKNDEETLKNMGYGAAGGFVLGHAIDQSVQGISKLIAKRRASRVANEADAVSQAENSEFLRATDDLGGSEIKAADGNSDAARRGAGEAVNTESLARGGEASDGAIKQSSSSQREVDVQTMTAREFATSEAGLDEETAAKVVKEAAQGKEKSDFVDADTYADIVKFKNFENQRDYARAYGEQIEVAKQSLESAREQSAVRYAQTQKAINEYQKQGMSASATRELINAKFKPSADEINYTRAYNDGADVDPRLAGQGIFYAIEKDIAAQAYTPEIYAARLKQRGFSDESAQAFTQAYVKKDINIAKDWANGKAAEVYENDVRAQVASEIKAKNEIEGEGWTMKDGGTAKQYAEHKFEPEKWINDLSGVLSDEWIANLKSLALKHPEMFKSEADVFRVIKEIKDNPTHFFKNNRDDIALVSKILDDGSIGKVGIVKDSGKVGHVSKSSNKKELKRLQDVNKKQLGVGAPHPTLRSSVSPLAEQKAGANAHSLANESIISQKGNLVNEKEANGLRDSVSSVGDNAGRAGGRQAGDEQILRQGRRDTANASQTKRPAQSDEQVEQPGAAKADGQTNAAAATKQVVEKQGSGASIGGRLAANSNTHLGSGLVAGTLNSVDEDGNFSPERFAAGFLAGLVGGKAIATGLRKMTPKLYNQILGAAEKMPQMANGNPRLLGKLYSNGKDVSLNSFAGQKAITANVGKLDQAKAMLEKGADEVEIWQKTGWFKDKDGAWKFEIGDSNARLNPEFQSGGRLGELLDHEELFKAYPELKDVTVVKIGGATPQDAAYSVKDVAQKEKRGIYNVTYNDKTATLIKHDLDNVESALKYTIGNKDKGAKHINIRHMKDESAEGYVTQNELLNVGKNMREYLAKYEEPFINKRNARIYEWQDERGVRFRLVASNKSGEGRGLPSGKSRNLSPITNDLRPAANDGLDPNGSLEEIITFYSDRNLKGRMKFENPKVKYDVNLSEWHKDSAPVTKNADGSPKVFYHGSNEGGLNIFKRQPEGSGYGFWFTTSQKQANEYASAELIPGYLKITKPFEIEKINDYDTLKNIFGLSEKAFKEFQSERQIWRKAMEKLRVREFRIADKDHLGFMLYDKNGDYVQTPNQMLVHDVHTLRDAGNDELAHFVYDKYYDRYVTGEVDVLAAVLNKNDYDVGKNFLRNKLKRAGYDGIKIDDNVIVVFDSAQIKHVKNNGNFSDSPNIYKSGAEGYYDPARNEIGLSDLGDRSTLMHEVQHAIQKIEDFAKGSGAKGENYRLSHGEAEARNVQNRLNLDGKAHPHETFDVNPNETIVSKEDGISYSRKIEEIKREHPNVERELDESIAAMRRESFNDSNFKDGLISKFDTKEIITQELGKSLNLSDKQLAVLKNDIKNADFKVINESKIYFDKIGKDGDKKRFFVDIAEDGSLRVDGYSKKDIDSIPVKQSALEELAGVGDAARLKNMSFEVKAAYRNELDPIKKEAILKTAELNKLKKAAQSGDKAAAAKFEEFKAKNLDENGNIKDGLSLC
nr:LPD23 domain-containing protein [uncultured Campylobacter sp.]